MPRQPQTCTHRFPTVSIHAPLLPGRCRTSIGLQLLCSSNVSIHALARCHAGGAPIFGPVARCDRLVAQSTPRAAAGRCLPNNLVAALVVVRFNPRPALPRAMRFGESPRCLLADVFPVHAPCAATGRCCRQLRRGREPDQFQSAPRVATGAMPAACSVHFALATKRCFNPRPAVATGRCVASSAVALPPAGQFQSTPCVATGRCPLSMPWSMVWLRRVSHPPQTLPRGDAPRYLAARAGDGSLFNPRPQLPRERCW